MSRLVSVESGLEDIKAHLNAQGYDVVDMMGCVRPIEAVVYSGEPLVNSLSVPLAAKSTILVNATGLTPEEVVNHIENKLG